MNARTPRYEVLEEVSRITDAEIDLNPRVAEMLNRLASAKTGWHAARKAQDSIRFRVEKLPAEIEAIEVEISAINHQRPASIAAAILGGGEYAADDALLKRRAALLLQSERLRLALPALEQNFADATRRVEAAANPASSLQDDIEKLRHELKLAEAERRCA